MKTGPLNEIEWSCRFVGSWIDYLNCLGHKLRVLIEHNGMKIELISKLMTADKAHEKRYGIHFRVGWRSYG